MPTSHAAALDLPPPFTLVTLREAGDAFAHATENAGALGAGTLVWARRFHLAEFAIVLEPEATLREARSVIYAAGNALYNALSVHAPPQFGISFDWPATLRVDGALVGGLQLSWPNDCAEDAVPDWLVLGCIVRTDTSGPDEPGERPLFGGLNEQGFEDLAPSDIVEGFARYFVREMNDWTEEGFGPLAARWRFRAQDPGVAVGDDGDGERHGARLGLGDALATPAWLDAKTGEPFL